MNRIGFMQGRLSPQVNGKIQAFPEQHWQEEFDYAKSIKIDLMEWTLDSHNLDKNPLLNNSGRKRIKELSILNSLKINSITGDFAMQNPFWKAIDKLDEKKSFNDIVKVIDSMNKLKIKYLVIPLVDNGAIENTYQQDKLVFKLNEISDFIERKEVIIIFESDFDPISLKKLISKFPEKYFGINYDTGNSAALGYDPEIEIKEYGHRIKNIHIKDRKLQGTTVALKRGNADFDSIFKSLNNIKYSGDFILQTARATDNDHIKLIAIYKEMVADWITKYFSRDC